MIIALLDNGALINVHAAKTSDQRYHNIGQHGDLEEFHEHVADQLEIGNQLTEEQAGKDTRPQSNKDSSGQTHLFIVVLPAFAIG